MRSVGNLLDVGGILMRESVAQTPSRCLCCDRPRKLQLFRNGPKTQLAVCPSTRASLILFDFMPAIVPGVYTGSLDGV
ncbi:MAG TPA: hypothetical protein VFA29_01200 [Candidatus Baltobacteraceae bacterium]|nr:hypothetical protein [Candidatus Baltobacteraceae bacterium]